MVNFNVKLSKFMSWFLRHNLENSGITYDPGGWVRVSDLINYYNINYSNSNSITINDIVEVVKNCVKQRFSIRGEGLDMEIRANQGHSKCNISNSWLLTRITEPLPVCVHGTTLEAWNLIKINGLSRMSRQHIHMAIGIPGDNQVISGMRTTSRVVISVDMTNAIHNGIPFYMSSNGVILSPGPIPIEYFSSVIDRKTGRSLV